MTGRALFAILALLAADLPGRAEAEDSGDEEQARLLFVQALAAAEQGDYQAAVEGFARSYELAPRPATLLNLSLYQEAEGQLVAAYRSLQELLDRFAGDISEAARAQSGERLAQLEGRLALVDLASEPPRATFLVDGEELPEGELGRPLILAPGSHGFEARLEGHAPSSHTEELVAGQRLRIFLALAAHATRPEPEPADGPPALPGEQRSAGEGEESRATTGRAERRPFWRGPWPWVIGAALLTAGAATATALLWPQDDLVADREWTFR